MVEKCKSSWDMVHHQNELSCDPPLNLWTPQFKINISEGRAGFPASQPEIHSTTGQGKPSQHAFSLLKLGQWKRHREWTLTLAPGGLRILFYGEGNGI